MGPVRLYGDLCDSVPTGQEPDRADDFRDSVPMRQEDRSAMVLRFLCFCLVGTEQNLSLMTAAIVPTGQLNRLKSHLHRRRRLPSQSKLPSVSRSQTISHTIIQKQNRKNKNHLSRRDRNLIGEMICQFCPDGTGTASGNQLSILLKLPEWFDFKCRRQMICGMMNADICESRSRTIYGSVG